MAPKYFKTKSLGLQIQSWNYNKVEIVWEEKSGQVIGGFSTMLPFQKHNFQSQIMCPYEGYTIADRM